jgi:hypothetical protein
LTKLALIALVLGACVADDPTNVARVLNDDVTPRNVVDQVEILRWGDDNVDLELVEVTGLEVPGGTGQDHIDMANVGIAELNPIGRAVCALAETLPGSDVCSVLCDAQGFAARAMGDIGSDCTEHRCELPGGVSVLANVCVTTN